MSDFLKNRRNFMTAVAGVGGAALGIQTAQAADELRFPGDKPKHHVVYQINKNDPEYQTHILNSMSAMITEFGGNVQIAVVAFAAGIHLLAKSPQKTVNPLIYERVQGFSENYGVVWDACGKTMHTVGYSDTDMRSFAKIRQVGAAALMEYQEQGYAYIAW
ncbi:MAG: DsrE family protein [Halothiobacillus sp.]|jgi:intracellular sulfur oxidation DsrE/DsrF family protein|nr:DsrE family protein [Halothiobacillus sp.]